MTHTEEAFVLMAEAHRLLDLHAQQRIRYYAAPTTDNELLDTQQATMTAIDNVIVAIAMGVRLGKSPLGQLQNLPVPPTDPRAIKVIDDVVAKMLALTDCASTNACDGSSAA